MSARKGAGNDLDLSLSGSQIMSARSSSRKASSSNGRGQSGGASAQVNGYSHEPRKRLNSAGRVTPRLNTHTNTNNSQPNSTAGNPNISKDFLALFEPTGARPKVKNKTPTKKTSYGTPMTLKSTPFPGSAESTPRSYRSKKANSSHSQNTSHSIFRPDSPLSVSNFGDGESTVRDSPQSTARYTPQSTARYTPQSTARSTSTSVADRLRMSSGNTPRDGYCSNGDFMNNEMGVVTSPTYSLDSNELIYNRTREGTAHGEIVQMSTASVRASTSSHKDLNATNNMLPQNSESRKPPKLELRSMQNSYQNATYNVNKTPVNEVLPTLNTSISKNQAENYIKRVNMAACVIQNAFRKYVRRKKALRASEAAMKRLFAQKREDMAQRQEEETQEKSLSREQQRQLVREEKAKQARMVAIEELNKRREAEKQKAKQEAEAEIAELKAAGKVGPKKFVTKSLSQRTKKSNSTNKSQSPRQQVGSPREQVGSPREQVGSSRQQVQTRKDAAAGGEGRHPMLKQSLKDDELAAVEVSARGAASDVATISQAGTTFEDLMSTLKLLEEDEELPPPPESRIHAWSAEQREGGGDGSAEGEQGLTAASLERHRQQAVSDAKLKNILSFLDEVETNDRLEEIDQHVERVEPYPLSRELPGLSVPSAEEVESMEQASAAASEVTNTVLKQRLQLEEKHRSVQMLQKALNQQRELTIRHARETEKEMGKRLDVQKNEYEETVQRHLNFIDQLIDDKRTLSDKCEGLVAEMKQMDKKYSDKIRQMQETHDRELAKVKEMITTQEKLKREKWIEEKTKKIKDLTVKGLEPEIQRLIGKHKAELKKLKTIHEAEMLQSDERAGQRYVSMTEELRDQLAREKETACQRERELAAQRYEKQLQAEEEAYQQARRRLYQEVQDEKERLASQASRQRQEVDKLQRQLEESHTSSGEVMRREYDKAREEQERRHETELIELKDRLAIEKEAWQESYMKKQEAWLLTKERELKEAVKQERDKEIELVINRLEDDGVQAREECERAAENRIKRIRTKYETELEELERSERSAIEKYNQMKAELLEAQGEKERLKVLNRQKEQEVEDTKRLSEKLHRERDHVQDVVRQEFADKLIATDEENKWVKQEMAELKSRHKLEIERMKQEVEVVNKSKQEEMDAVHNRVKQAIAKKEEVVNQVKQQYQAALKRADHLESLLEQQRKQLLGGNNKK